MLKLLNIPPKGLFWSAPSTVDSDFGHEDPLALDYLAQRVGFWLFSGFTTRTSRAQYYLVVLYGLRLAERAIRDHRYLGHDETRTKLFMRWECFWALATLESRGGTVDRGDDDAMRGIRGAKRWWSRGEAPLKLDFPLISRQIELGGLGAYLSSLREYKLVNKDSLTVTVAADEMLKAFWAEAGDYDTQTRYEEYALNALDLETSSIQRRHPQITLAGIGKRSRLSSIRSRIKQQHRLWDALFLRAGDDSTLPLAEGLIAADRDGVFEAEALLKGFLAGRWKVLPDGVSSKVEIALAFGRVARVLLSRFNRVYEHVYQNGLEVDFRAVAQASFPISEMSELRLAVSRLLKAKNAGEFRKLPAHGSDFLTLLSQLVDADAVKCLQSLLHFHFVVQRSRRGGGAWLRDENGKLAMRVEGYNGYKSPAAFPRLKLDVVRRLLTDLGKIV